MLKTNKTNQKIFNAAIAATMVLGTAVAASPSNASAQNNNFSDLNPQQYYYEDVMKLATQGIIKGFPDGTYKPHLSVTRGEAAKILASSLGLDIKNVKNPGFIDVKETDEFYGSIAALVQAGIIDGNADKTFKKNDMLTRSQMAKILVRGYKLQGKASTGSNFTDIKSSDPFADDVQTILANGITKGMTATTFSPHSRVTRGQIASFIVRSEKAVSSNARTATIINVNNDEIELSTGKYTIPNELKKLLNSVNAPVLKGAELSYLVDGNPLLNIHSINIIANGTESSPLIFDGGNEVIDGSIKVNSDYVKVVNLEIKGNLEIGYGVKNSFHGDKLTVKGKTLITDEAISTVNQKSNATILFTNSTLNQIDMSKSQGTLNLRASNVTDGILVSSGSNVTIDSSKLIPKLTITGDKTTIVLSKQTKITNLILPKGRTVQAVIKNYQDVKGNIANINGLLNKDASLVTSPPSGGGSYTPNPPTPKPQEFELNIMHFNDTHGHLDDVAKRVTAVKEVRMKKPDSLLLDAGDVFSGTLYFNEFLGQADLEFMNLMKVDAMTFGNHEFDLGSTPEGHKALVDFIKAANFPFVSANIDFSKDDKFTGLFNTKISNSPKGGNIYTGIVKEVKGEKIGIFGLTTADTKDISSPGAISFSDYIDEAKKMVAEFEKMGVNKIIALTHIGYDDNPAIDNDIELAKAVEGIDIIVGGHSHTTLAKPVLIDDKAQPTIIVQAGQYGDNLGTLDVTFDGNGVVVKHNGELIKIADKVEDPEAAELLVKYSDKIKELKEEPTGATALAALENPRDSDNSVRRNETPLGNVITDGMLAKARKFNPNVIMALQNGGGIRAGIDAGPITVGEVITVLPFGNTLATMELTGAELKQAFETSLRDYPRENGGFLHVSGTKVVFDSSKPVGKRVISIKYKDGDTYIDIQDNETYTIATNAFTAKGGDGFDVFKKIYEEGRVIDLGLSDWENLAEHLRELGEVNPKIEGRIIDIAGAETEHPGGDVDGEDFSGTEGAPKVYNDDVTVTVTNTSIFANVVVKGNLVLKGKLNENASFSNLKVTGNFDLSKLDGTIYNFDGIEVEGETIF